MSNETDLPDESEIEEPNSYAPEPADGSTQDPEGDPHFSPEGAA